MIARMVTDETIVAKAVSWWRVTAARDAVLIWLKEPDGEAKAAFSLERLAGIVAAIFSVSAKCDGKGNHPVRATPTAVRVLGDPQSQSAVLQFAFGPLALSIPILRDELKKALDEPLPPPQGGAQ